MSPENTGTQLTREGLEKSLEAMKEKGMVDADGCLPPPPPSRIQEVIAKMKAFNAFMDDLERLGYPQYNAICSFNGWEIHQTKGKRTP